MSDFQTEKIANLLIVEDDDSMRRFLEVTLKKQNYEVFTAKDGLEAMELALNNEIHVIVTDAMMPNLTGYDLCRILRQIPDKKHIPLILLSGFDQKDKSTEDKYLADFYLTKGNNLKDELISTVSKILT
jgi:CheY-like chemotaxis protein